MPDALADMESEMTTLWDTPEGNRLAEEIVDKAMAQYDRQRGEIESRYPRQHILIDCETGKYVTASDGGDLNSLFRQRYGDPARTASFHIGSV